MSRFSKAERHDRRQALEQMAVLGDDWLAIRDAGTFLAGGCVSWDEFRERVIAPTIPAAWRLTAEQAEAFVDEAIRLAEIRRRHTRVPRCR